MYVGGIMTIEWQNFFRDLYNRVGGESGPVDLEDLTQLVVSQAFGTPPAVEARLKALEKAEAMSPGPPVGYEKRLEALEQRFGSLPLPTVGLAKRIEALEKAMAPSPTSKPQGLTLDFLDSRVPFNYYLPTPVWDDLRFPVGSVRGGGAFDTTPTAYKGGIVEAFSTGPNNESIQWIAQLPHATKLNPTLEFHMHYVLPAAGAGAGVENIKFDFTYSWADINDSFPAETSESETLDVQSLSADTHYLLDWDIDMTGAGSDVSSILICSLTRDVGVANDYASSVYFLEADFHIPLDTFRSREEYVK